ncbi:hypothetical protein V1264_024993 [Littorina saxatilis]
MAWPFIAFGWEKAKPISILKQAEGLHWKTMKKILSTIGEREVAMGGGHSLKDGCTKACSWKGTTHQGLQLSALKAITNKSAIGGKVSGLVGRMMSSLMTDDCTKVIQSEGGKTSKFPLSVLKVHTVDQ